MMRINVGEISQLKDWIKCNIEIYLNADVRKILFNLKNTVSMELMLKVFTKNNF